MNFVWILGSGSKWNNNEIRYSIRSVLKFHPNATITIVGEKPDWYNGYHYYVPDDSECPYVNKWVKMEFACTLFDEFVQMDDDFFLLEPYKKAIYYHGTMAQKYKRINSVTLWSDVIKSTLKQFPDEKNHLQHFPLPVRSKEMLRVAEIYPNRTVAPSISLRQCYCVHVKEYPEIELQDMKVRYGFSKSIERQISGYPFFSISDHIRSHSFRHLLEKMYPNPSIYELDNFNKLT